MHGNSEGLRSITTFALPESNRRVNKRMREQKKNATIKKSFFFAKNSGVIYRLPETNKSS